VRRSEGLARLARGLALGGLLGALVLVGHGPLAIPLSPAAWSWAHRVPPSDLVFALLRLVALAAGSYLLVALLIVSLGELTGDRRTARVGCRMVPASLRGLLALGAGAAVVAAAVLPAVTAQATPAPAATRASPAPLRAPPTLRLVEPTSASVRPPTLHRIEPTPPPTTIGSAVPSTVPSTGAPVPWRATAIPRRSPRRTVSRRREAPADSRRHERPIQTAATRDTRDRPIPASSAAWVTVRPGDSFWLIATRELEHTLGRAPSNAEVAPYWSRLVAVNAARLPVAGQPDLLFAGDRVLVPPPAAGVTPPPAGR
jgi:hypothetical protein